MGSTTRTAMSAGTRPPATGASARMGSNSHTFATTLTKRSATIAWGHTPGSSTASHILASPPILSILIVRKIISLKIVS